jgi:hypothetical protein
MELIARLDARRAPLPATRTSGLLALDLFIGMVVLLRERDRLSAKTTQAGGGSRLPIKTPAGNGAGFAEMTFYRSARVTGKSRNYIS